MEVSYFINNKEVHRPLNYAELTIELNYDTDDQFSQAVTLTEFEWGLGSQVTTGLADAVVEALNFYKKNGWSVVNANEKDKMYLIMKKIQDDTTDDDEVSESDDTFPETDEETEDESSEDELIVQPISDEDGDIIMRD